jgi:hypothetical protein
MPRDGSGSGDSRTGMQVRGRVMSSADYLLHFEMLRVARTRTRVDGSVQESFVATDVSEKICMRFHVRGRHYGTVAILT